MAELDRISAGLGYQQHEGSVARRIEGLDAWVLPLALGIAPAAYSELRRTIGTADPVDVGGAPLPVSRREQPAEEDLRRAASLVASIAFRLWSMGSLQVTEHDDKLVELARPLLDKQRGDATGPSV